MKEESRIINICKKKVAIYSETVKALIQKIWNFKTTIWVSPKMNKNSKFQEIYPLSCS